MAHHEQPTIIQHVNYPPLTSFKYSQQIKVLRFTSQFPCSFYIIPFFFSHFIECFVGVINSSIVSHSVKSIFFFSLLSHKTIHVRKDRVLFPTVHRTSDFYNFKDLCAFIRKFYAIKSRRTHEHLNV